MHRRIAAIAFLTITACPQDDADPTDGADEIEASTAGGPDLPVETTTETESETESETDESTEDSGESTSAESTGEDDIDSSSDDATSEETGSEAVPTSLEVHANGQRIGHLMAVWDYGFTIWDDVNEVQFQINQQAGHVVSTGGTGYYHTTPDCTGQRYENAVWVPMNLCGQLGVPTRRMVRGDSMSIGGHVASANLLIGSGPPIVVATQSLQGNGACVPIVTQLCVYPVQPTNVIPKTFALPITVVEAEAMP